MRSLTSGAGMVPTSLIVKRSPVENPCADEVVIVFAPVLLVKLLLPTYCAGQSATEYIHSGSVPVLRMLMAPPPMDASTWIVCVSTGMA